DRRRGGPRRGRGAAEPEAGGGAGGRRRAVGLDGAARGTAVTGGLPSVRIASLAAGGEGVGRLPDGRAVFVPRTAPGDLVELGALREHRNWARAEPGTVLEPGPDRVAPRCAHYDGDRCGGCQWQHLSAPAQRRARAALVGEA